MLYEMDRLGQSRLHVATIELGCLAHALIGITAMEYICATMSDIYTGIPSSRVKEHEIERKGEITKQ